MSGLEKHLAERGTYFSVVTNDPSCRASIKEACLDYAMYAYIDHEPDDEDGKEHTHFLLRANGTRTVAQVAEKLQIPGNYVQVVKKVVAFKRYLIHFDQPDKKQYSINDLITNDKRGFEIAINGGTQIDTMELYKSFKKMRAGIIEVEEFINTYCAELNSLSFSQKIKIFEIISKYDFGGARVT